MEITIEELQAQPVLYIRTRTSQDKLSQIIGESYTKIADYVQRMGGQPAGMPYAAYHNLDMKNLDVELGFPVSKSLPDGEGVKAGESPSGRVVSALYKGAYSRMEGVYNEISTWIGERSYEPSGVYYEYYYNSPQDVPESELLTKIVIPLK